ncbi:MAG: hypothetical protein ACD_21C00250G0008 [uncultured bacterium]|nr:MAG: hypothetical protein ACD_21C00250G0008 [uncultured bacterium]
MKHDDLTIRIVIAMFAGAAFGLVLKFLPGSFVIGTQFINNILALGGNIFISLMKVLVVPIVFVSIVCGVCSLEKITTIGSMGFKAFKWFIITTSIAVLLAIVFAYVFQVGMNLHLTPTPGFKPESIPSLWQLIGDIVPNNPVKAMADANMLQIIVFSLLFGIAINIAGDAGRRVALFFVDLNTVLMKFIMMLMRIAPYGVFCLIAVLFVNQGFDLILGILNYFLAVLVVLCLQTGIVYSLLLRAYHLSPKIFFSKMYTVMLFAFGVSSSNASIPIALDTIERKLGVSNAVASFVVPLGININKNGTAIMQGVAAVFISHAYHLDIGLVGNFILFIMIILSSIGTAGVPGVGMVTLVMILQQLGLPAEGIALIIGVDRLLDMTRTAVNVTGNAIIACLVGRDERQLDYNVFRASG